MTNNTSHMTLADIIRTVRPGATRNTLKNARAKMRRLGLTNLNPAISGPYAVTPVYGSTRNYAGVILASVVPAAR